MVRNNTVIVLGAGASQEFKLPTGAELKTNIATLLDFHFQSGPQLDRGDEKILRALQKFAGGYQSYLPAAYQIRDALPLAKSIDDYLEAHKDNEKIEICGKLAIVRAILITLLVRTGGSPLASFGWSVAFVLFGAAMWLAGLFAANVRQARVSQMSATLEIVPNDPAWPDGVLVGA